MKVCLFDIDGTLIHAAGAGRAAIGAAIAAAFGAEEPAGSLALAGRTDRAIAADVLRASGIAPSDENLARLLVAYLEHLPGQLASRAGRVLPGVRELLGALDARSDVIVGLLTGNFRKAADIKLAHFDLEGYFHLGGFGDRHLDRDDVARDAVAEIEHLLGQRSSDAQIWVIGDTPHDVRSGRAIGARVVAVANGFGTREELLSARPDHLLDDLGTPDRFLELLAY